MPVSLNERDIAFLQCIPYQSSGLSDGAAMPASLSKSLCLSFQVKKA